MTSCSSRHPITNQKVHKSGLATDSVVAMAKDQSSNHRFSSKGPEPSAGFQEDTYAMAHPHTDAQAKVINSLFNKETGMEILL